MRPKPALLTRSSKRCVRDSCASAETTASWNPAKVSPAFSERFTQKVGSPPMEYLIAWRMALAKDLLQRERPPLETVAAAIGYQSASAFSTAFRRQVGRPPSAFARRAAA